MNSHEVFIHIHQGCFAGTGATVRLPQCQWSKPDGYGKISQCITTTKHSKAVTVCIFLGIYCIYDYLYDIHCISTKQLRRNIVCKSRPHNSWYSCISKWLTICVTILIYGKSHLVSAAHISHIYIIEGYLYALLYGVYFPSNRGAWP